MHCLGRVRKTGGWPLVGVFIRFLSILVVGITVAAVTRVIPVLLAVGITVAAVTRVIPVLLAVGITVAVVTRVITVLLAAGITLPVITGVVRALLAVGFPGRVISGCGSRAVVTGNRIPGLRAAFAICRRCSLMHLQASDEGKAQCRRNE
jgi:hypothetical protein